MPELPEVQTVVAELQEARLLGHRITDVKIRWQKIVAIPQVDKFRRDLTGQTLADFTRRGKFIMIKLQSGKWLLIHLRMTGQLLILPANRPVTKHEYVILRFDDRRTLRYHDPRKFGRLYLVDEPEQIISNLGWEPLDRAFTLKAFSAKLSRFKRQIKPLLLDQTFIAGLGNIYVDEALFEAYLHPLRPANSLKPPEIAALHRAIRRVLRKGIQNHGTSLGNGKANFASINRRRGRNQESLKVFQRQGQACPRCGTVIRRIAVGQRSTHFCPYCQRQNR